MEGVFQRHDVVLPQAIVTDNGFALINAVATVFSVSYNFCQLHIHKNARARCKTHVYPTKKLEMVMAIH